MKRGKGKKKQKGWRKREKFTLDPKSVEWMRMKVKEHNDKGTKVFVQTLVPISREENKRIMKDDFKNWTRNYPPGKDKMQQILKHWVESGEATWSLADGIMLTGIVARLPRKVKGELIGLASAVRALGEKSLITEPLRLLILQKHASKKGKVVTKTTTTVIGYSRQDWLSHYALRQSLAAVPTKYWIAASWTGNRRNMAPLKNLGLLAPLTEYVDALMGKGTDPVGLDSLILMQKGLWKKPDDFKKMERCAEQIVSGVGTDGELRQWKIDMNTLLKLNLK